MRLVKLTYFGYQLMRKLLILPLLFSLANPLALAIDEEDDILSLYDDEELISIATGTQKKIHLAPSVASIVTAKDIAEMGARNLAEAIEGVPGIHVSDSLLFDDDLISIRGIHTSNNPQVMLLIDGVEVRHLFTAARPAGFRLPLDNVQRIEIIRGPGSAVYGADAFSGVINVITKSGSDLNGTHFGGRIGSFNTQDGWVQSGIANDNFEAAFSFEYTRSDGDHDRIIESDGIGQTGRFRSEYEVYNTQIKTQIHDWRIRFHNWRLSNGGNGPGGAQILDDSGSVNSDYYQLDVGYEVNILDSLLFDIRAGYNRSDTDVDNILFPKNSTLNVAPDGNLLPAGGASITFTDGLIGNPSADAEIVDFDITLTTEYFEKHVIRIGAGYKNEDFDTSEEKNFGPGVLDTTSNPGQVVPAQPQNVSNTPFVFVDDVDREVYYFSIQDEWSLADDWALTVGVRYDDYSDVGDTINPRLALVWAADYNLTAKFLYGRAFRAPSFTELFSKNNPTQLGNADLDPETIDTVEAAVDYRVNHDLSLTANIFYYEVDDLIDFVLGSSGLQAQNAIDQTGYGLELSSSWNASEFLEFEANFSWQDIESRGSSPVADVPSQQLYTSVNWEPVKSWHLNTELHWIGKRERNPLDLRSDTDDYLLVNFTGNKNFPSLGLDIGLTVKNLFDKDAEEPSELGALFVAGDYPIEGRSILVDISYNLK